MTNSGKFDNFIIFILQFFFAHTEEHAIHKDILAAREFHVESSTQF
ncbi:protein of unknown function [Cupriavidus taiwanensis]|uniref:Uncharacterized protein n=1 Tax=Cupriavidus taiwanensis TaxID=164546 RepID=A0A7Z7J9B3_9BURK|nr:protein of unknown function [Cupriavidus taiwanensis]SOZ02962.1 hypothetical protein CBM2597_A110026 [Cupriavidus taiwanensis]SPC18768.1 hypothetical protein CBM2594_A80207 [Cupriavidus taiwanensis]SPD41134.1 protein of unknown function [Cupriavidus taiwanensis]